MKLKVFRPTAELSRFAVIGESSLETITPGQLDTFPTEIPVQAGDVLGYTRTPGTTMSVFLITPNAGDMAAQANGADDPLGSTTSFNSPRGYVRLDISAVLRQRAGIGSVGPSSGPITGGTQMTIGGHDFTGATAVSFGSTPATSFMVNSDGQITAVSPAAPPGAVDLTVTTPLGTSSSVPADRFAYTACVVPKLKHRDLKAAKEVLRKKECRPGKVSRVPGSGRAARVIKQGKRPQTALPPGAKVSIRLGG